MIDTDNMMTFELDCDVGSVRVDVSKIKNVEDHRTYLTIQTDGGGWFYVKCAEMTKARLFRIVADVIEARAKADV